jgi:MscS family membrane protein
MVLEVPDKTDTMASYNFLNYAYLGNTIWQYIAVLFILLSTFILAKITYYLIKHYLKRLSAKTETKMDDVLVSTIERPLVFLLLIIGVYYAVIVLTLPLAVKAFFANVVKLLITMDIAYFIYRFVDAVIAEYLVPMTSRSHSRLDDQLVPIIRKTVKVFIIILAFVIILNNFGYNVTSLLAGLGIGGLAFALAAKDTLGNIFGSITIFADKPFQIHDKVKIGDTAGIVQEVGMRSTRIKTYDGTIVTVPNSDIVNAKIENVSKTSKWKIRQDIGVVYGTSARKLEGAISIIKDILKRNKNVDDDFNVHFAEFAAYSLVIKVSYWLLKTDYKERMDILNDINFEIKRKLEKAKIEMAFPTQTVYLEK